MDCHNRTIANSQIALHQRVKLIWGKDPLLGHCIQRLSANRLLLSFLRLTLQLGL